MVVARHLVHQAEWRIVGSSAKFNNELDDMIRPVWSRLIRATSQAYWAGYAPTVVQWENDLQGKRVIPTKFMDLVPEHSEVNWKKVDGYAPPGHASLTLANAGEEPARLLLLGGPPFQEEIVMWWNFIGRSHDDIVQAREDWTTGTRFGEVHGYDGASLPAPELPNAPLKPRRRMR